MKVKVCEEYALDQMIYDIDRKSARDYMPHTYKSDYSSKFVERDVTLEELEQLIKKGAAIKINC